MMVEVYLVNYCDEDLGQWLSLPASNTEIRKTIDSICPNGSDKFIIKEYKSALDVTIPKDNYVYRLNDIVSKLNKISTSEEIIAFIEAYSSNVEEILEKMQRGRYKFYLHKSLTELAYEFRKKNKQYKRWLVKDVLIDLKRKGYVEALSGVIYIYGY